MADQKNFRDARTGQYVSDEYAKENPDTTVSESEYEAPVPAETSPQELAPGQFTEVVSDDTEQSDEG